MQQKYYHKWMVYVIILLLILLLIVYFHKSRSWYLGRIKYVMERRLEHLTSGQHQPSEPSNLKQQKVSPPLSPASNPSRLNPKDVMHTAAKIGRDDLKHSWRLPSLPEPKHGHAYKVPGVRKVLIGAGRVSAVSLATVVAVPMSVGGGIVGGTLGIAQGPAGIVSGTVLGFTSGGAMVFRVFGFLRFKNKEAIE